MAILIVLVSAQNVFATKLPDIKPKAMAPETELQQTKISGTISDASTREPMPGVNVLVKGTTLGALTDINGKYTLVVPDPANTVLIFSFVGYTSLEIPVAGKTVIDAVACFRIIST